MTRTGTGARLAMIGLGPRALGALEALAAQRSADSRPVAVDLFDPGHWLGAGPNFRPDDSPLCLLNIPLRLIDLPPPRSAQGPKSFPDWAGGDGERFPPRAELGAYLVARMAALTASRPDGLAITHHAGRVSGILREGQGWWLVTEKRREGPYDEVLLCQGQPATTPDPQLSRWQDHATATGADLLPAYPADRLLAKARHWTGRQVAIRGLGLSTFDVLRLLTCGLGGRFADGSYHPSGQEPSRILPFSLDGHAPVPKPASAVLDAEFDPLETETAAFLDAVRRACDGPADAALATICAPLQQAGLRILRAAGGGGDASALAEWLAQEQEAPGSQEGRSATEALRAGIIEASGAVPPSTGYVVGQLMRKWQNALRQGFNPSRVAPETAAAIIGFDEGLKRFSYGPPISSARELLMLIEAGLVDLRAADDPGIRLVPGGWDISEGDVAARVTVMIDAVLPPPDLSRLADASSADPLMAGLLADGRVVAVGKGLGARTLPDARLIGRDGQPQPGLCLLGRLAQGSVIAVDSLHDCFGAAAKRWAEGVAGRLRAEGGQAANASS